MIAELWGFVSKTENTAFTCIERLHRASLVQGRCKHLPDSRGSYGTKEPTNVRDPFLESPGSFLDRRSNRLFHWHILKIFCCIEP